MSPPARAVDGVREINQTSALVGSVTPGDTAGFPVEIFTSASFRLTSDLVVPAGAAAGIAVYATGTRIDLNGFTISSGTQCSGQPTTCTAGGNGVGIDASGASDVKIQNGRISGFGVYGIFLYEQGTVSGVTVDNNGQGGINGQEGERSGTTRHSIFAISSRTISSPSRSERVPSNEFVRSMLSTWLDDPMATRSPGFTITFVEPAIVSRLRSRRS